MDLEIIKLDTQATPETDVKVTATPSATNYPVHHDENHERDKETCFEKFETWSDEAQIAFIENLLMRMTNSQHGHVNTILKPMLQRDFITVLSGRGFQPVAENILSYLDANTLCVAELVCSEWHRVIGECMLWKKLICRKVANDPLWKGLGERRGWFELVTGPSQNHRHPYFRALYPKIIQDIATLESNWNCGNHALSRIHCHSENIKGVYCLQYDDEKIICGLRDNTIKLWDRNSLNCIKVLHGHTGSVLCLQYDDKILATGSSDATVRIWDVRTGEMLNMLIHHCEAVLHMRFQDSIMITCSKDRSIAVWDMQSPTDIILRRVLVGHRAAVNVVDFDDKYIVSASGDRTIKVWNTENCDFVKTLVGHRRGIACLQYMSTLVVSGSSDYTIRLWDVEIGSCIRILEGHEDLVRCIRFDSKHIISGAYDGTIKVWDLQAALDTRQPHSLLCIRTLAEHTGRVFRIQFDDFQIVSSSHDDSILIWDFLNGQQPQHSTEPENQRTHGTRAHRDTASSSSINEED